MLQELSGFLLARQAGTRELAWTLAHHRQPATRFIQGLAAPGRDVPHWLALLRERLARTVLAHPVEAMALRVTALQPLRPQTMRLDGEQSTPAQDWPQLVETLRARLGDEAVLGVQCRNDHRPEQAWQPATLDGHGPASTRAGRPLSLAAKPLGLSLRDGVSSSDTPGRPLWLLSEPLVLPLRDGLPCLGTPLHLESGPERLESGWWDGGDIARDYFIARDAHHGRYWIYRERRGERRWFLHGYFA